MPTKLPSPPCPLNSENLCCYHLLQVNFSLDLVYGQKPVKHFIFFFDHAVPTGKEAGPDLFCNSQGRVRVVLKFV